MVIIESVQCLGAKKKVRATSVKHFRMLWKYVLKLGALLRNRLLCASQQARAQPCLQLFSFAIHPQHRTWAQTSSVAKAYG